MDGDTDLVTKNHKKCKLKRLKKTFEGANLSLKNLKLFSDDAQNHKLKNGTNDTKCTSTSNQNVKLKECSVMISKHVNDKSSKQERVNEDKDKMKRKQSSNIHVDKQSVSNSIVKEPSEELMEPLDKDDPLGSFLKTIRDSANQIEKTYRSKLHDQQNKIDTLETDLKLYKDLYKKVDEQCTQSNDKINTLLEKISNLEVQKSNLEQSASKAEQLAKLQEECTDLKKKELELEDSLRKKEEILSVTKVNRDRFHGKYKQLEKDNLILKQHLEMHISKSKDLENKMVIMEKNYENLYLEKEATDLKCKEFENRVTVLENDHAQYQEQIANLEQINEATKDECINLKEKLALESVSNCRHCDNPKGQDVQGAPIPSANEENVVEVDKKVNQHLDVIDIKRSNLYLKKDLKDLGKRYHKAQEKNLELEDLNKRLRKKLKLANRHNSIDEPDTKVKPHPSNDNDYLDLQNKLHKTNKERMLYFHENDKLKNEKSRLAQENKILLDEKLKLQNEVERLKTVNAVPNFAFEHETATNVILKTEIKSEPSSEDYCNLQML